MVGAEGMVQPGMDRPRIYEMGEGHLRDPAQTLAPGMRHHPIDQGIVERDEAMHRVVDDLAERHLRKFEGQIYNSLPGMWRKVTFVS
jgi:hypothetical protein